MKKSIYISLLFINLAFLGGCAAIDKATTNIGGHDGHVINGSTNVEDSRKSGNVDITAGVEAGSSEKEVSVYFVRTKLILTAAQRVLLAVDDKEIGKIENGGLFETKLMSGNYEISAGIGMKLTLGLQGVCTFADDFNLTNKKHYFKVDYDIGIWCGEYKISEISESEYNALSAE